MAAADGLDQLFHTVHWYTQYYRRMNLGEACEFSNRVAPSHVPNVGFRATSVAV